MAQIGYGYGSEFQLLRFLGHHRDLLEQEISKVIGNGPFQWLDFGFDKPTVSISGDKEIIGLSFLKKFMDNDTFDRLMSEYHSYRINNPDQWQNWDAVFIHNGVLYFVEAKAHISELRGKKDNGGESQSEILRFMQEQLPSCTVNKTWLQQYYQFANRLATTALVGKYLPTKFLYIFFENGYRKRILVGKKIFEYRNRNLNASKDDFEQAFANEMKDLRITPELVKDILAPAVYINAEPIPVK